MIGCGGIGKYHLERLARMPEVELAAYADAIVERARECASRYGGRAYRSYSEMLEKERLDAVFICVPPYAHGEPELLCAEKGVNVFVEKPVALDLGLAREISGKLREKGLVTQVGYHSRFSDSLRTVRRILLEEGGGLGVFEGWWHGGVVGGPEHWWRRREMSGGQLVEQSTHIVDLARWYMGEVEEVQAVLQETMLRDLPNFNIEAASVVALKFSGGAVGSLVTTCMAQEAAHSAGFRVFARALQAECNAWSRECRVIRGTAVEEVKPTVDPYYEEDLHFITCVMRREQTYMPYEEGVRTLEVTLAAHQSARTGRAIRLPL